MMITHFSPSLLGALLDAERAIGRLSQATLDERWRRRLWADAARRNACAAARLDGVAVDGTEFLIATIGVDLVPTAGRSDAQTVRALWQGDRFCQGVISSPPRREGGAASDNLLNPLVKPTAAPAAGSAASVWAAISALESGDHPCGDATNDFPQIDEDSDADDTTKPNTGTQDLAWTLGWLEQLWRCQQAEIAGREPERLVLSPDREAEATALLRQLDEAATAPGLSGGAAILAELLRLAPDQRLASWLTPPARSMAALTIARCCRAPTVWLPMAVALYADRRMAGTASRGTDDAWKIWLTDATAEAARAEVERLGSLQRTEKHWHRRIGQKRRNSRLPDILDQLFEEPAVTVRRVQRMLGSTFRGAQLLVDELVNAGILREVTNRALDRVFVAVDLIP